MITEKYDHSQKSMITDRSGRKRLSNRIAFLNKLKDLDSSSHDDWRSRSFNFVSWVVNKPDWSTFIYHLQLHCTIIYCCTVIYWCKIIFCCTTIYDCPIIALSSNIVSSSTIAPLSVTAPSFPLLQHITTAPPSITAPPSTIVLLHHHLHFSTIYYHLQL
jgi:hypothetical protein